MTADGTNVVVVTGSNLGQGRFLFAASGSLQDDVNMAAVQSVQDGSLDENGDFSVSLLASDNEGFTTTTLTWTIILQVAGLPYVFARDQAVNYADGSTQDVFSILAANGYSLASD